MKRILHCCLLCLLSCCHPAYAQFWLQQGKGPTIDEALSITSDANGNTYSTGYFSSSITFDSISVNAQGTTDIFITKTNNTGAIEWVRHAGGLNIDKGLDIAVDNQGHLVVAGYFYGAAQFESQTLTSAGQQDIFIAKYDTSGQLLWVKNAGGTGNDVANSVAFDPSGNILITGEFSSSACHFDGITLSAMNSSLDVFTAKYDAGGNAIWAKSGNGKYTDRGTNIASDASGNVYVSGEFSDTINFDLVHNNVMYNALFVIKYNPAGQEQWFRYMGSGNTLSMTGLEVDRNNDLVAAGNYTGSLQVFGLSSPVTVTNTYQNNFFLAKFHAAGDIAWTVTDGSDNLIHAEDISIGTANEIFIGGEFTCRLNDYADRYGQGVFCSDGFSDCFVASYDAAGTWSWSRSFGGNKDDYLYGLATSPDNHICTAGAFNAWLFMPESRSHYLGYPPNNVVELSFNPYCSDNNYYSYAEYYTMGNSDIYIGKPIDLSRQPMDYFDRRGAGCTRDFLSACIQDTCPDSLTVCDHAELTMYTHTMQGITPVFQYQWNTLNNSPLQYATTTGTYSVTATTEDGCFTEIDTTYLTVHPNPQPATISDNKLYNDHNYPANDVHFCIPDSATVTGFAQPGDTLHWLNFPAGMNPVTVSRSNTLFCQVINQFGCTNITPVNVIEARPLSPLAPVLFCETDTDRNDTIVLCNLQGFTMYIYDSLSNPGINLDSCIDAATFTWSTNPPDSILYTPQTICTPYSTNIFYPEHSGWFDITAEWDHGNCCGSVYYTVTKSVYVILNPTPTGNLSVSITGSSYICPGNPITLTATGASGIIWSDGTTGDTLHVQQPGTYWATADSVITNSYGCTKTLTGIDFFQVSATPQPVVAEVPANAVICPNDSVLLTCSGAGSFNWQGPNGAFGSNDSSAYVTIPGTYYCIRTDTAFCTLVSNTLDIVQYNTPFVVPSAYSICNGQPVTLTVYTNSNSTIQWLPPLSGKSATQVVNSPGTYSCNITSCGVTTPVTLRIDSSLIATIITPDSVVFCSGDSVRLMANPGMANYQWMPNGETSQNIYASQTGQYNLFIQDHSGCTSVDSISITSQPNTTSMPVVNDTSICKGTSVSLIATGSGIITWADPSGHTIATGSIFTTPALTNTTLYFIRAESGVCRTSPDSVIVLVIDCDTLVIPNIITPNNDGKNDYFPGPVGGALLEIKIYNRWGLLVYEGSSEPRGWNGETTDGKPLSDGTYYYIIGLHFPSGDAKVYHGFVLLNRE